MFPFKSDYGIENTKKRMKTSNMIRYLKDNGATIHGERERESESGNCMKVYVVCLYLFTVKLLFFMHIIIIIIIIIIIRCSHARPLECQRLFIKKHRGKHYRVQFLGPESRIYRD